METKKPGKTHDYALGAGDAAGFVGVGDERYYPKKKSMDTHEQCPYATQKRDLNRILPGYDVSNLKSGKNEKKQ